MKKNQIFVFLLSCVLFLPGSLFSQKYQPINSKATKEARQLLEFLYSIKGKHTLTGQHNFPSDLKRYDDAATAITKKTPAMWGGDFSFMIEGDSVKKHQHCGPMNLTVPFDTCKFNKLSADELRMGVVKEAIGQYNNGRIITLMWHCCFPTQGNNCCGEDIWVGNNKVSDADWLQLTTDGTELNRKWKIQVDSIASYLKILQKNNVPVLWRPYHEMNGAWFWWGGKPGEDGYKKLWIMMYNYMTKHHKLNNLLWVWNANAIGPWVPAYKDFYPGSEYVDALATDVYRREYTQETYDDLDALGKGKIVALGEIGEMPTMEQFDKQPYTWFMSWGYYINKYNDHADVRAVYEHPRTITLDEMDFSKKTYKLK